MRALGQLISFAALVYIRQTIWWVDLSHLPSSNGTKQKFRSISDSHLHNYSRYGITAFRCLGYSGKRSLYHW